MSTNDSGSIFLRRRFEKSTIRAHGSEEHAHRKYPMFRAIEMFRGLRVLATGGAGVGAQSLRRLYASGAASMVQEKVGSSDASGASAGE